GLGGPARFFVEATDEATVIEALGWAAGRGAPLFVLGGGSNLVVGDGGFDGLVLRVAPRGLGFAAAGDRVLVRAAAGEPWDALVAGPSVAETRAAVLALRRRKSMVIDAADPNRRSVGSFFTNPVVPEAQAAALADRAVAEGIVACPQEVPRFPADPGAVKLA